MKKRKIAVFDPVYNELSEAVSYYESKARGLGIRFYTEFENALYAVSLNAEGYAKKYKKYRNIRLKKFPFILIFEVREKTVLVIKLIHTSKHPGKRIIKRKS